MIEDTENDVKEEITEQEVDTTDDDSETNDLPESEETTDETESDNEEESDGSEPKKAQASEDDDAEDGEVTITIGDEPSKEEEESQKAPPWVKELRKTNREQKKQLREANEKINALSAVDQKPIDLGAKPTLEDDGIDYDTDKYTAKLDDWHNRKAKVDVQKAEEKSKADVEQKAWDDKRNTYNDKKQKIKVKDYDEAEYTAQEALSITQQGIIIQGAQNPALVTYVLGKNPEKLRSVSQIKHPVEFAFAVSKMESEIKVSNAKRRPGTTPEKRVRSSASNSGVVDGELDRLRVDAAKSGDYSKVTEYRTKKNKVRQKS